jgi:hypothetical protein
VFVLPVQFADYMRQAGVGPRSALRNSYLEAIGQANRLEVIQGVPTYADLDGADALINSFAPAAVRAKSVPSKG